MTRPKLGASNAVPEVPVAVKTRPLAKNAVTAACAFDAQSNIAISATLIDRKSLCLWIGPMLSSVLRKLIVNLVHTTPLQVILEV